MYAMLPADLPYQSFLFQMVQMRKALPQSKPALGRRKIIPAITVDLPFHTARNIIKAGLLHRIMLQFTDNSKAVCQTLLMMLLQLTDPELHIPCFPVSRKRQGNRIGIQLVQAP